MKHTMVRLDGVTLEKVDAVVVHLEQRRPSGGVTRAGIVRELLNQAVASDTVLRRLGADPHRVRAPKK